MSIAILPISFFQNCSKTSFSSIQEKAGSPAAGLGDDDQQNSQDRTDESQLRLEQYDEKFELEPERKASKVDILFVVDESISMQDIISNVNKGLSSLSEFDFPEQVRMAVTNMAPARVGDDGLPIFSDAYKTYVGSHFDKYGVVEDFPGFMKLVSRSSIADFKAANSGKSYYNDRFSLGGCAEWFEPLAVDNFGQPCLAAAAQITETPTAVEAGVVSLKQLLLKYMQEGQKLFRDGSTVNVVFVSDTHDPGHAYYGNDGAYKAIPAFSEVKDLIQNHHAVANINFSAIAPLPHTGHSALDGIHVIGETAKDRSQFLSLYSGERYSSGARDAMDTFSYLDFVRPTKGVAIDPLLTTDWKPAMAEMIEYTAVTQDPVITLKRPIRELKSIKIDGQIYDLEADKAKFEILGEDTIRFPGFQSESNPLVIEVSYMSQ